MPTPGLIAGPFARGAVTEFFGAHEGDACLVEHPHADEGRMGRIQLLVDQVAVVDRQIAVVEVQRELFGQPQHFVRHSASVPNGFALVREVVHERVDLGRVAVLYGAGGDDGVGGHGHVSELRNPHLACSGAERVTNRAIVVRSEAAAVANAPVRPVADPDASPPLSPSAAKRDERGGRKYTLRSRSRRPRSGWMRDVRFPTTRQRRPSTLSGHSQFAMRAIRTAFSFAPFKSLGFCPCTRNWYTSTLI